jgi:heme-degrading monooxygenase HmoA
VSATRILTTFRSRLRPGVESEYEPLAERMDALARKQPGFVSMKRFDAEDGERLTVIEFSSWEAHRAWRDHPEHRAAQQSGRDRFYAWFCIDVAETRHHREFPPAG